MSDEPQTKTWPTWALVAACAGVTAAAAVILSAMGQGLWCRCGGWSPWSWDIWSSHNSQHVLDPYSASHVLHGVVFFWVGAAILRARWPEIRWVVAMIAEAAWEIAENTDMVIDRYREATISLDYYGDSVINSTADIAACTLGYLLASRIPWWAGLLVFVGVEVVMAITIRDTLLLNVLMLVHPVDAVRTWQAGG